jgi:tetraacyldisaccharide 4'-kinase
MIFPTDLRGGISFSSIDLFRRLAAVARENRMMYSPREMKLLLLAFSLLSRSGSQAKNLLYDLGIFKPKAAPFPVISVGNIALGGTEKTPLVMELMAWLLEKGRRPALVSRGYKGRWEKKGGVLSDGKDILGTWEEGGDEPFLVARRLPRAGVFVGKNRLSSCLKAWEAGFDIGVLDDAFQHRRLRRDLDIVLYSPEEKIALREPFSGLRRADILLLKKDPAFLEEREKISRRFPKPLFAYSVISKGFYSVWSQEAVPDERLAQKKVLAFCGIARPQRFIAQVKEAGLEVVSSLSFPDHYFYPRPSLEKIIRTSREAGAEAVVTTEKDSVKISTQQSLFEHVSVFYLRIGLRIEPGFYEKISSLLEKAVQP